MGSNVSVTRYNETFYTETKKYMYDLEKDIGERGPNVVSSVIFKKVSNVSS